jgi:hypothetical protein
LPTTEPGELRVTMVARWGEEYRWQLAALLADTVVLQYNRVEPVLNYYALREICARTESEDPEADSGDHVANPSESEGTNPSDRLTSDTSAERGKTEGNREGLPEGELRSDIEAILAELAEEEPESSPLDYTEWMQRILPEELAGILRFFVHLAAAQGPSRILLTTTTDRRELMPTWNSLRGVYYWDGAWGCCDPLDWITPSPPYGAVILKDAIDATGARLPDIAEIFASYKLGENTVRGHVPLIP